MKLKLGKLKIKEKDIYCVQLNNNEISIEFSDKNGLYTYLYTFNSDKEKQEIVNWIDYMNIKNGGKAGSQSYVNGDFPYHLHK